MAKFSVLIRGPEGFLELGTYEADSLLKDARDVAKDILNDLQTNGYTGLFRDDGSYSVIHAEAVLSFSVSPVKEKEE